MSCFDATLLNLLAGSFAVVALVDATEAENTKVKREDCIDKLVSDLNSLRKGDLEEVMYPICVGPKSSCQSSVLRVATILWTWRALIKVSAWMLNTGDAQ
jgi:hypothetical protein